MLNEAPDGAPESAQGKSMGGALGEASVSAGASGTDDTIMLRVPGEKDAPTNTGAGDVVHADNVDPLTEEPTLTESMVAFVGDALRDVAAKERLAGLVALASASALGAIVSSVAHPPAWLACLGVGALAGLLVVMRSRFAPGEAGQADATVGSEALGPLAAVLSDLERAKEIALALPEPIFVLNADGIVILANPAAETFIANTEIAGRHFATVLRAPDVFDEVEAVFAGAPPRAVDFETLGDVGRSCRAFVAALGRTDDTRAALVFVRDLTQQRRVEQMRADFIASASHELRTPLASLVGFIETLRGHARDDEAARDRFLRIMQGQAERMQRLVADLMSLSRIELNEHIPPNETVDVALLAQEVIDGFAPILAETETVIEFEGRPDESLLVAADRDEVMQAIQNLVDNAIKYGGEPAVVKISVGRGEAPAPVAARGQAHRVGDTAENLAARLSLRLEDLVHVKVQDFGPGIDRSDLPRLTERFYRVNVERSRKRGGTGLGLAIVKHIVNRHRGGLEIASQIAVGTAFTLYFPARS
ncbi:MAG: ATP-binding protein [Pseudomonadota bacterium]